MRKKFLIISIIALLIFSQVTVAFGATSTSSKPKAPTMNSAVYADDGSVDVVWSKVSGADKYEIYRSTSKDGKYTKIATVSSKNRIYNDTDVELYKNYYYKLKTVDDGKKSSYSKVVYVFTEGYPIHNDSMEFLIGLEDGRKDTWGSGDEIRTTTFPIYCTVMFNGKATGDFKFYYDKANVKITKNDEGKLTITPKTAGRHIITFVKGEAKGTLLYDAKMLPYGNVTFDCKQYREEQDSMSVKVPELKESVLTIKSNGKVIKDFKVTTSNKNVCVVKKIGSQVTVTTKNPGTCNITVTYKGQKTVFKWIVRRGAATAPYINVDGITVSESIAKEKATEIVTNFTDTEYSKTEIKELAKANLTLEEAAEKISTVQDAVNYLSAKGMGVGYMHNPNLRVGNIDWHSHLSAKFTYEHMAGCCGAISNLMNILLEGDYDSQGYVKHIVNYGGHTYNFFIKDGIYYICDFMNCFNRNETDKSLYLMFVTDDIYKLTDYYKTVAFPDYNKPESEDYLYHLYAYELDGYENVNRGIDKNNRLYTGMGEPICNYLPDLIEDTVHMLYVEDSLEIFFAKAPTRDMYPPEVNIPKD